MLSCREVTSFGLYFNKLFLAAALKVKRDKNRS